MNLNAPISTIMSTSLVTVGANDPLSRVRVLFEENRIHHIPVVDFKKLVGIVSKTDFMPFMRGIIGNGPNETEQVDKLLSCFKVSEVMTKGLGKLESDDRINVAVDIFSNNWFHALPVVDDHGDLVGIVTTQDIIRMLAKES